MGQQSTESWKFPLARTRWAIVGFVVGVFTWAFVGGGKHLERGDKASEGSVSTFDNAVRDVTQRIQDTTTNVRGRISDARESASDMSLATAVKSRIGQEGAIDAERIEVEVAKNGVVVLKGQVPSAAAKERAVQVARDTDGVQSVEDNLAVPPARRVFTVKDGPATH